MTKRKGTHTLCSHTEVSKKFLPPVVLFGFQIFDTKPATNKKRGKGKHPCVWLLKMTRVVDLMNLLQFSRLTFLVRKRLRKKIRALSFWLGGGGLTQRRQTTINVTQQGCIPAGARADNNEVSTKELTSPLRTGLLQSTHTLSLT